MGSREGQVEEGKLIKGGYLESEELLGIDRVGQVLILRHFCRDDTHKGLYDAKLGDLRVKKWASQSCNRWVLVSGWFIPSGGAAAYIT
ncbi:hypothetical protein ACFX2K_046058 [Malus domestica]